MAEESDLEKTEEASPKRIEKAREEGDVPRSRELATCTVLLAAGLGFSALGGSLNQALKQNLINSLKFERAMAFDPILLLSTIVSRIGDLLLAFLPLAGLLFLVAVLSPVLIGGWNFSEKAFLPNFNKLNPLNGLKNMVSSHALVELIKALSKSTIVGLVGYLVISHDFSTIVTLSLTPLVAGIAHIETLLLSGFLITVSALVLIAAIDVPYQLWHYADKLKMTKEEVRQEAKESDGNPEIKARVRQQQREIARRRMMSEIPKADVVITNPTHYAVAIQYAEDGFGAPRVLAKGVDTVALKIREIAKEHNVLTLESPKLARALYANTELGGEIPEKLYSAVAEVLAYVFQLRIFHKKGGVYPNEPRNVEVPDELDPHSLANALGDAS